MASDTNIGLGRRTRPAYCTLAPLVGLFALATPLVGQAKPGPFYHVNYYQVRPGDEKAHDSALVNVLTPLFNEMVKRKAMVSYLLLTKTAGSREYTNLTIVEVASPSSEGGFQRNLEAASQALFRMSWSDATARLMSCAAWCTPSCTRWLVNSPDRGTHRCPPECPPRFGGTF